MKKENEMNGSTVRVKYEDLQKYAIYYISQKRFEARVAREEYVAKFPVGYFDIKKNTRRFFGYEKTVEIDRADEWERLWHNKLTRDIESAGSEINDLMSMAERFGKADVDVELLAEMIRIYEKPR